MKKRILSIDIMRGLALLGMMLVNLNPDEALSFRAIVHTEWSGITPADVFFPCFLFLAGVSAAVGAEKKIFGRNWFGRALKRGITLIVIGMIYNHLPCVWSLIFNSGYGFPEFFRDVTVYFRPFGVLQRIGFAYIFGILIYHYSKTEKKSLAAAFVILAVTTAGFFLYRFADPFSEADNISILFDQALQGSDHNYLQKVFDPEGMYGNITAVASMLFGIVAGMRLKDGRHMESVRLGCALSLAGWILSPVIMVSKPLWTATYVLILSGCFMILLPAIGSLTDAGGSAKKWLKLPIILGSHSMLTYLVSGNIEAILNAVKVGDTNLFHYIWEHTVRFNNGSPFSCLLCSLIAIVFVCVIVCVTARVLERRESRP